MGHCRQGHAWLLHKNEAWYEQARRSFQKGIALSEQMEVPRLKIEAFWGLCQAHGFPGNHQTALTYAREGIALARLHGDEWVEMSIRLAMGATYTQLGMVQGANEWLAQAMVGFHDCSDTFGETAVRLRRCLLWHQTEDETRLKGDYLQAYSYETWSHEERERLRARYLQTADRLAQWLANQEAWETVIDLCQNILQQDDCWENAYRLLIQAHARLGNRVQALRAYQRCETALQTSLGVLPAPATVELYETIR